MYQVDSVYLDIDYFFFSSSVQLQFIPLAFFSFFFCSSFRIPAFKKIKQSKFDQSVLGTASASQNCPLLHPQYQTNIGVMVCDSVGVVEPGPRFYVEVGANVAASPFFTFLIF